jgi:hypothetical protein
MKFILIQISVFLIILTSCNNKSSDALKFNDSLITVQDSVVLIIDSLNKLIAKKDSQSISNFYSFSMNYTSKRIKIIKNRFCPDEYENIRVAFLNLLKNYLYVLMSEYPKIIRIQLTNDSNLNNDSIRQFNSAVNEVNRSFNNEMNRFIKDQQKFAKQFGFIIPDRYKYN